MPGRPRKQPAIPKKSIGKTRSRSAQRSWSERYGQRHQLVRIVDFPAGIAGPRKVRLYQRCDHFVLQWWDPAAKGTLSDRVDGDLVAAIARARQIEERLTHFRASGQGHRRLGHAELVEKFLQDLARRADAGEIDPRTVERYRSALGHYLSFVQLPETEKAFPHIAGINRAFQLEFASFLNRRMISSNGHPNCKQRPMKDPGFVEDAVRAMYQWGSHPERGHLLPDGFRNPFLHVTRSRQLSSPDPVGLPDITHEMAAQFIRACDAYQLRLFAPILFYGLRAAEPCFLFREHVQNGWLKVPCIPELAILTKGRRSKTLPIFPWFEALWTSDMNQRPYGLLLMRRPVAEGREPAVLQNRSLPQLIEEFQHRCSHHPSGSATQKMCIRNCLLKEAGGVHYDQVEAEFHQVARKLAWPKEATVKDFRHLFSTSLENAGVPLYFRQYLMGQAPTRAPIATYTHLSTDQIRTWYERAISREFDLLVKALKERSSELSR